MSFFGYDEEYHGSISFVPNTTVEISAPVLGDDEDFLMAVVVGGMVVWWYGGTGWEYQGGAIVRSESLCWGDERFIHVRPLAFVARSVIHRH